MGKTTIQISTELNDGLNKMKIFKNESYEEIIWDWIDDRKELSDETKKNIAEAEEDLKAGRVISHQQLKKELGLWSIDLNIQKNR